jgi:hypothetical protein
VINHYHHRRTATAARYASRTRRRALDRIAATACRIILETPSTEEQNADSSDDGDFHWHHSSSCLKSSSRGDDSNKIRTGIGTFQQEKVERRNGPCAATAGTHFLRQFRRRRKSSSSLVVRVAYPVVAAAATAICSRTRCKPSKHARKGSMASGRTRNQLRWVQAFEPRE